MRILVVGAGAIGGYFGGCLLDAGADVTFLVRPRRAEQLARTGLSIQSKHGNLELRAPTVLAEQLRDPFDLILLSCKAYDLDEAMTSFAPAVGANTSILPMLNGMRHLDALEQRFGARSVLGGWCAISTTLDDDGRILHLSDFHTFRFGERDGSMSPRVEAIAAATGPARFDGHATSVILQEMWEKFVTIGTVAGITCLMRAPIGDIVAAGAGDLAVALLEECGTIARKEGYAPGDPMMQRTRAMVTTPGSMFAASMLRDIERGARTECEHILGDLLRRGRDNATHPVLRVAYAHVATYEAQRARRPAA